MNYYKQPDVETIPARIHRLSQLGMLAKRPHPQAFEMFFAQLMKKHPDKIAEWMKETSDLPEAERKILVQSVWMSQTKEGKQWLRGDDEKDLAEKPGHPLTEDGPSRPRGVSPRHALGVVLRDGREGSDRTDRRQVRHDSGRARRRPATASSTRRRRRSRATSMRYAIGGTAVWSATSLATNHDRLFTHLKEIHKYLRLSEGGGAWLKRVLEKAEEDSEKDPNKAT